MPIAARPDAPPRRGQRATSGARVTASAAPLSGRSRDRADGLAGWFEIAQIACITKGWHADAGAITMHGPRIAEETARVAESAEPVGKVLDMLAMSGPYAALVGAVLPFAAQIAMNHKIIPEVTALQGVVPPATLEAQVKAELAEMQMAALRVQQQAEAALAEVRAEMNGAAEK